MTNSSFAAIQTIQCLLSTVLFAFLDAQIQKRPKTCIICSEIAPLRRVCLMMMLNSRSRLWIWSSDFFPMQWDFTKVLLLHSVTNFFACIWIADNIYNHVSAVQFTCVQCARPASRLACSWCRLPQGLSTPSNFFLFFFLIEFSSFLLAYTSYCIINL